MMDVESAQSVIDRSPFGPWWGFAVQSVRPGWAQIRLGRREELLRPGGVLQGGCAMTLADVTCWIAILALFGEDDQAVTQQMTTSFLGAARSDLICESEVMRPGRRVVYSTASVRDDAEKMISHHTVSYMRG